MQTELSENILLSSFIMNYDDLVDYVRRHFSGNSFAADVVHDVCVQLIENPPTYEIAAPLAFLRKATFNRALDRTRSEKIRSNYQNNLLAEEGVHYFDGASALDIAQKIEAMRSIVEQLPTKQRQVFLLYQIHGLPQHQIASEMGISTNMVTKHFTKAINSVSRSWCQLSK